MPQVKLTQRVVDDLVAAGPPDRDTFLWDIRAPGFGVRRKAGSEAVSFVIQWRDKATGKSQRKVLGDARRIKLDVARGLAGEDAATIVKGGNPLLDRKKRREALTLGQWIDEEYLKSDAWKRKAATTQAFDRGRIEAFIRPALGVKKLPDITSAEVQRLRAELSDPEKAQALAKKGGRTKKVRRGGEGGARRTMRLLKAMLAQAVEVGALEASPAAKVKVGADGERGDEAVPDEAAYQRLWIVLAKLQAEGGATAKACDAVLLIAMTGARRNEVGRLRARHVALGARRITLPPPEHKGRKSGKARVIALPDEAVAILSRYDLGDPDAFVFAGPTGRPIALHRYWTKIKAEAELDSAVIMHGLRPGIGTILAAAGMTPVQIAQQLGHAGWAVSQRYVHAVDRARQDLAQKAADLVRPAKLRAVD